MALPATISCGAAPATTCCLADAGRDELAGEPGIDAMTGGGGADRFLLRQPRPPRPTAQSTTRSSISPAPSTTRSTCADRRRSGPMATRRSASSAATRSPVPASSASRPPPTAISWSAAMSIATSTPTSPSWCGLTSPASRCPTSSSSPLSHRREFRRWDRLLDVVGGAWRCWRRSVVFSPAWSSAAGGQRGVGAMRCPGRRTPPRRSLWRACRAAGVPAIATVPSHRARTAHRAWRRVVVPAVPGRPGRRGASGAASSTRPGRDRRVVGRCFVDVRSRRSAGIPCPVFLSPRRVSCSWRRCRPASRWRVTTRGCTRAPLPSTVARLAHPRRSRSAVGVCAGPWRAPPCRSAPPRSCRRLAASHRPAWFAAGRVAPLPRTDLAPRGGLSRACPPSAAHGFVGRSVRPPPPRRRCVVFARRSLPPGVAADVGG